MESILRIAAKRPAPKKPRGNEFTMLQSFLDYRHLVRLADAGRWDLEAMEGFKEVLNRYSPAYIRERCEQRVTLLYRPLVRYWLNTAFYTARDPESRTPLLEYLEKYFPYQEDWSRRFVEREDGSQLPRTIAVAMGEAEIDCYPMHMEYRVNEKPVYHLSNGYYIFGEKQIKHKAYQ